MARITELGLKALSDGDVGRTLYDEAGLRGEVRLNGGAVVVAFSFRYRFDGKVRELRCGSWPRSTLKQIRAARDAHSTQHQQGIDPGLARQQARAEQLRTQREAAAALQGLASKPTTRQLFEEWHRREASQRSDGGAEIRRAFEKDVLPKLGGIHAEEISRRHVMAVLDEVKERGVRRYANILLQYLRQMFRFAAVREIVRGDPTFGILKKDAGGKDSVRERFLSEPEIRELAVKLPASGLPGPAQVAVWIMLATLCRIGELSRATWNDVDLEAGTWRIPKEHAKNRREHIVHLSGFAIEQFRKLLPSDRAQTSVFPSRVRDGHRDTKSLQKQFYDRQRSTPLKKRTPAVDTLSLSGGPWRAHDLRRSGATLMGELGVRSDVIERCLNHVGEDKLRKIYQLQKLVAERSEAFAKLGDRLMLIASGRSNVVSGQFRRNQQQRLV